MLGIWVGGSLLLGILGGLGGTICRNVSAVSECGRGGGGEGGVKKDRGVVNLHTSINPHPLPFP